MAVTERAEPMLAGPAPASPRGFRPGARKRTRIALGAVLLAVAVGGNLLVYSSLDDRTAVLQVVRDVPAGTQLSADDLRAVEVAADATVRTVAADQLAMVVGQHAKVRLVSGSLVVVEALQPEPLVAPGSAVVAVQVPDGALPIGLRERSEVQVVLAGATDGVDDGDPAAPRVVDGRVVGLPTASESITGTVSVSIEVPVDVAALVATADDVGVVLLEPGSTSTGEGP
jgi:hypothetical protein